MEIANLKKADNKEKQRIYEATIKEIQTYGSGKYVSIDGARTWHVSKYEWALRWVVLIVLSLLVLYSATVNIYSLMIFLLLYAVTRLLTKICPVETLELKKYKLLHEFISHFPDREDS